MDRRAKGVEIYSWDQTHNILSLLINGTRVYSYSLSPYQREKIERHLFQIHKSGGEGFQILKTLRGREVKGNAYKNSD